ncbi:MAG: ATPase [Candidatus Riflebacteria bacterium HGW-Riflebacteria-1]|jgi:Ca2+-transporting ATPase|nr:MAG: ATPase [Candidatus Riflebacteria bacterium HGW-Riflebacteria-1]
METIKTLVQKDWSTATQQQTLTDYQTGKDGLSSEQARNRLADFGNNEIAKGKPTPWYVLLGRQFTNPLIYILLAAALITVLMQHYNDVIIIFAVLIINAAIGFYQERKAERAINNIKGMSAPLCRVRRDSKVVEIKAIDVVPGDIILLEEGDKIPADARIIAATRLQVEEAIFTGESIAADKTAEQMQKSSVLADKHNMLFSGTHVTAGRGEAVVTATAMNTELGKIAGLVQSADEILTPLQRVIEDFSHMVIKAVLGICSVIFVSSYLVWGQDFDEVLLNAIAIAVSAIPEGLPVIITLVLAVGVRRMAKHQALIRKLPTVETLGSATVICTDKTGTLTRNEMVVTRLFAANKKYEISGEGYSCDGKIQAVDNSSPEQQTLLQAVQISVLCNNAALTNENNNWKMVGDATEGALMTLAGKHDKENLSMRSRVERLAELPFDSRIKFMVTVDKVDDKPKAHMKGSLEAVLERCSHVSTDSGIREITQNDRDLYEKLNLEYASEALRVIGLAFRNLETGVAPLSFVDSEQSGYTFAGMVGIIDLPRPEAVEAVGKCRQAGIKVVMITGDHAATALAIGKMTGIYDDGMKTLTGADLAAMSDEDLKNIVLDVAIYARTSPEDKMRIIQALQSHKHVVSMTGDGVNDAPALTRADIGVAMGRTGTDVAREAAGMILVNDNFASIVSAVEEGRIIFNNLRKAIGFLVSTNVGEVLIFLISSLFGLPAPLRAVQILWVNLVTDGTTSVALGVDPAEGDEMQKPPRRSDDALLSTAMRWQIAVVSVLMCVGTLLAYRYGVKIDPDSTKLATSMAFCTVVFFQLFNIFNCRSFEKSIFSVGIFGNPTLVGAVILAAILQLIAIYVPFMQELFGVTGLTAKQMAICLGISFSVIPAVEITKKLRQ